MAAHNELGKEGEILAREYFLQRGYSLMACNWKHASCEIDIIASRHEQLHFIEVKTRKSHRFGYPEESIDMNKFRRMQKAATAFLEAHPGWKRIQYDILSISIMQNTPSYFYIEDVYLT